MKKWTNYEQICCELVESLIDMCFETNDDIEDDELFYRVNSNDFECWKETFCRKLLKHDYITKENGEYVAYVSTGRGRTTKNKKKQVK